MPTAKIQVSLCIQAVWSLLVNILYSIHDSESWSESADPKDDLGLSYPHTA